MLRCARFRYSCRPRLRGRAALTRRSPRGIIRGLMTPSLILPHRLEPGATVALVAPASPPPDPAIIDDSLAALTAQGFRVLPGRHLRARQGFLAGTDRQRAGDLMRAFRDPRVRAIFCLRGGYGTTRLLPLLDYSVIRDHPKILVGYSDITALHCAILQRAGLLTFHGPMLASELNRENYPAFSRASWQRTLMQPVPPGSICQGGPPGSVAVVRRGRAEGQLIGGNLSLLCALLGTPWQPDFRGRILFMEDVGEAPYRLDRLLTHLHAAGVLAQVAGVAVGVCHNCLDPRATVGGEYRQSVADVLRERLSPLRVPVVVGLPFGHVPHNATLPVGGHALLDARGGDLLLTRPAVT